MIPTANHQGRGGARVRLVVLHTTEGATSVGSLGAFFQHGTESASYHAAFDGQRIETFVPYSEASWSIRTGNNISDNAAFCCAAVANRWTRAQWLAHPRMLELGALWVAERCKARGLPIRRLSYSEVAAAQNDPNHPGGVIEHHDWTIGAHDGTHTDCGPALPWDVLIPRAQQLAGLVPVPLIHPPQPRGRRHREDEDDMQLPISTTRRDFQILTDKVGGWCGAANLWLAGNTDGNTKSAKVFYIGAVMNKGASNPVTKLADYPDGKPFTQWWADMRALPAGTTGVIISYLAPQGMAARIEYEH